MSEKLNSCTLSSFLTGRQLDPGPLGVGVVGDHGGVVSGGPGHLAAVSVLLLQVADDGSLGHGADGHHVADGELGALAAVHELAGVHALNGHEQLLADLVSKKKSNGRGVSVGGKQAFSHLKHKIILGLMKVICFELFPASLRIELSRGRRI